jgi:N-acetyl-anhydromuramyl-L-alanine amidase AmpD
MKNILIVLISILIAFSGISLHKEKEMIKPLDISAIVQHDFPSDQYVRKTFVKTQIPFHHTVSGDGVNGDVGHWERNRERVATPFIIARSGVINQLFSSKYGAYHLGLKAKHFAKFGLDYMNLNFSSIPIEFDSWGGLKNINGVWCASPNDFGRGESTYRKSGKPIKVIVPDNKVITYGNGYRGYDGFEKYTDEQIESGMILANYLCDKYNIPKDYNENMFEVNKEALSNKPGIWTHTSYRPDKSDCHPQPELISALKSLV